MDVLGINAVLHGFASAPVEDGEPDRIPAVVDVDGTARAHTAGRRDEPPMEPC